jgi:hypothetical protein
LALKEEQTIQRSIHGYLLKAGGPPFSIVGNAMVNIGILHGKSQPHIGRFARRVNIAHVPY